MINYNNYLYYDVLRILIHSKEVKLLFLIFEDIVYK